MPSPPPMIFLPWFPISFHVVATQTAGAASKSVRVRVAVRVRPFLPHEHNRETIIHELGADYVLLDNYRYDGENLRYAYAGCCGG